MTMIFLQSDLDHIESLIDKHGLPDVMLALSHICEEKAEHVTTNWRNTTLAKAWDKQARQCELLADKVNRDTIVDQ